MSTELCSWCKKPLNNMRADARFCSTACRVSAFRATPCTYCGMPANTKDHVLSRRMREALHETGRKLFKKLPNTVPCCSECNSIAGARLFTTLGSKRKYIQIELRRRYSRVLGIPKWTEDELDELDYVLRKHVEASIALKEITKRRLTWKRSSLPLVLHLEPPDEYQRNPLTGELNLKLSNIDKKRPIGFIDD